MSLSPELLQALRDGAMKATPGLWTASLTQHGITEPDMEAHVKSATGKIVATTYSGKVQSRYALNADHIANCSPNTILALLDTLDVVTRERDEARAQVAQMEERIKRVDGLLAGSNMMLDNEPVMFVAGYESGVNATRAVLTEQESGA